MKWRSASRISKGFYTQISAKFFVFTTIFALNFAIQSDLLFGSLKTLRFFEKPENFYQYYEYGDMVAKMRELAKTYPKFCVLETT